MGGSGCNRIHASAGNNTKQAREKEGGGQEQQEEEEEEEKGVENWEKGAREQMKWVQDVML